VLSELKALHEELRAAIAELEAQTSRSEPDNAGLPLARLKVVRVSGRRKALIDCTIAPSLRDLSSEDARRMQDLRRAASDLAVETSQHIARWTMPSILTDWEEYRVSAAQFRQLMLKRIAEESAILYPLIEQREAGPTPAPSSRTYAPIPT